MTPAITAARLRHDLRTPVNHVLGYAELQIEEAEATGRMNRIDGLSRICVAAREAALLIDRAFPAGHDAAPETTWDDFRGRLRVHGERVLCELALMGVAIGNPVTADEADLEHIGEAARRLLRFADQGGSALGDAERGETRDQWVAATPAAGPPPVDGGSRILVVDDEPDNRELLVRSLGRHGYAAVSASNGTEALDLIRAGGIDLVLLDLIMPGLGGDEVLRRIKADARHRDLPVLMISALDHQDAVVRCIEMGAEDYLPKPADPILLRARMGACLARKRARDLELAYLRQVDLLASGAGALQEGCFESSIIAEVTARDDALGNLARVFDRMAGEVRSREQRLAAQVAQLRIEIDEARKARAVSEVVDSDYFRDLQRRAAELRRPVARQ